jgi:serine/threonine-protein kinase
MVFQRTNAIETMHAALADEIEPPSRLRPEIPSKLDAVLAKLLARNPEDRHSGAADARRDLEGAVSGHPRVDARSIAAWTAGLFD